MVIGSTRPLETQNEAGTPQLALGLVMDNLGQKKVTTTADFSCSEMVAKRGVTPIHDIA